MSDNRLQAAKPRVQGKFLHVGPERFLVKGVTYGTFAPDANGDQYPAREQVCVDVGLMAQTGFNTVRTYTPPRADLMDEAARHDVRVMIGLPWPQHIAFLDDAALCRTIRRDLAAAVRQWGSHPATLLFALGNEIPPAVVRWHGAERVEAFLLELYDAAKQAAPESLFTYVNFPPTDYLSLPFFDVCAFNVYLHRERDLRAYLARLQQIAGVRPLLLAEAGADSIREGDDGQATLTAMNLRSAFSEGACGAVAFAWTDQWWRGGQDVDDWAFGLVDSERKPKPALEAVRRVMTEAPFGPDERQSWPRVSVVVCAYNAADTIEDCLSSLEVLTYPNFEVIVVDDGAKDATAEVAGRFPFVKLIRIPNGGLSAARNVGLREATGEIVAYTDADVRVDPDWLTYLVQPFLTSDVVATGGPNVVPPDDPWLAQCVARAPGAPTHVLVDDRIAEHVPGCNMAYRREALLAIGGFNPIFLRAGDDVDVCWRLQARGWKIGFAAAALVWHHHRAKVKAYWRQQVGYGEGEVWLRPHHPDKFAGGEMIWRGRIYSPLPFVAPLARQRVNTGVWGTAPFPSVYLVGPHPWAFLMHTPLWQFASAAAIAVGVLLGLLTSERAALALIAVGVAGLITTLARCISCALGTDIESIPPLRLLGRGMSRALYRLAITWLHLIYPFARLKGRVRGYLMSPEAELATAQAATPTDAPARRHAWRAALLLSGTTSEDQYWSESWISTDQLFGRLIDQLRATRGGGIVTTDDGWHQTRDLSVGVGRWAWLDLRALIEEHKGGKCLIRVALRLRPRAFGVLGFLATLAALLSLSTLDRVAPVPSTGLMAALTGLAFLCTVGWQAIRAATAVRHAIGRVADSAGFLEISVKPALPRFAPRVAVQTAAVVLAVGLGTFEAGNSAVAFVLGDIGSSTQPAPASTEPPVRMLGSAGGVAIAPNGDLYISNSVTDTIRRLKPSTILRQVATTVGFPTDRGVKTVARFEDPAGVAVAPNGDLYIADAQNHRIVLVEKATGVIVTVAGLGAPGYNGDGRSAGTAMLNAPRAVALAPNGDLYIADTLNNRVRLVDHRSGLITTVAGDGQTASADSVGDGGPATDAHLDWPSDIALTRRGDLFIADMRQNRIRRVDGLTGTISTYAGTGQFGHGGDGGPAPLASLAGPSGIALASKNGEITLFIADYFNSCVRVVLPDGTIKSMGPETGRVGAPSRLAYHPGGWLYVADTDRDRVTVLPVAKEARRTVPPPAPRPAGKTTT